MEWKDLKEIALATVGLLGGGGIVHFYTVAKQGRKLDIENENSGYSYERKRNADLVAELIERDNEIKALRKELKDFEERFKSLEQSYGMQLKELHDQVGKLQVSKSMQRIDSVNKTSNNET